ncbi:MAG: hypothetical protein WAU05_13750 [Nitrospira sp.]
MSMFLQIVVGLMLGYAVVSLLESLIHQVIYHAEPRTRWLWAQHPRISGPFRHAYFSHGIVHHRWTFRRDFVTQFTSEHERERLDQSMQGPQGVLIRREHYGMTLRGVGIVWFNLPMVPVLLLIGLVCGTAVYSCLAMFVHPYLHRRHDAIAEASPVLRWMFKPGYIRFLRQHHYPHHRYSDCNFNLLLGGDVMLGQYRVPTA